MFEESKEIKKARRIVDKLTKTDLPFTLDTCVIVSLAMNNDHLRLSLLSGKFSKYQLTLSNIREIDGLRRSDDYNTSTKKNLSDFLEKAKKKGYKDIDFQERKKALMPLVVLLPRRLAHDVVFNLDDSYLNKIISLFENALNKFIDESRKRKREPSLDITGLTKQRKEFQKEIMSKAKKRFNQETSDLILVDRINQDEYWPNVENFVRININIIESTFDRIMKSNIREQGVGAVLEAIVNQLRLLAGKTYQRDVEYVAETIQRGYAGESLDNDVIWLFRFDAARKIA